MRINKFRIKIFLLITVSLTVPVLLCSLVLFSITERTVKTYVSENIAATLKANVQNIEAKLDVLNSACTSLLITLAQIPAVTDESLRLEPVEIFRSAEHAFTVHSSLIVDTYTISGFNYFYLYFPGRSLLIVSKTSFFDNVNYNAMDCLFIPENSWGVSTPYNHLIANPILGKYMTERNISKNFTAANDAMDDVILTVNLKEQYINEQLNMGFQMKPDYAIIIDSHGNVISSKNKAEIDQSVPAYHQMLEGVKKSGPSEYLELTIDGTGYILNREYSQANDWYYITALDVNVVTKSISSILDAMYVMLPALIVLSLIITVFLVHSLTYPLKELTVAMTEMKNKNFKVQLNADNGDEFAVIYGGFNEMAKEIDSLVHTITEEKSLKTETYIRLLQSEINPHMLYNSLESLYSMAKINAQEEIAGLVMALSKFFRISLSGGKRLVPFSEAFELAKQYIIVQNIRLNYKIAFEHDIPESLMNIMTPKFLLQPIVENAFQYGFKNRRETCRLSIKASYDGDCIRIAVTDNGIGIHQSDLSFLNSHINNFDFEGNVAGKGYALRNINYQLKLEYGNDYGLWLESEYGEYTSAIISIPDKTRGE